MDDVVVDDDFIRRALEQADPLALRVLLYQHTGDESLLSIELGSTPTVLGPAPAIASEHDVGEIQRRVFDLVREHRQSDGRVDLPTLTNDPQAVKRLMDLAVCQPIPDDELGFWREAAAIVPRRFEWEDKPAAADLAERLSVVVIGSGFSGVNAAIQLKDAGVSFVVLDRNEAPGGTWIRNRYPGIRVDVPSRHYSFTYEAGYRWKYAFAPQQELHEFMEYCIDKYDVRSHIRFSTEVLGAKWDEQNQVWIISVSNDGVADEIRANVIISAVGLLDRPKRPDLKGLDSFQGAMFHTSEWDHDFDLTGKRVAVIGTGSSGMQLTPDLAPLVGHLTVFQRSPGWVVPMPGYREQLPAETLWLFHDLPGYLTWFKLRLAWAFGDHVGLPAYDIDPEWTEEGSVNARNAEMRERLTANLMEKIGDRPDLVAKCVPDYPPMAKRFVMDNGWFDALKRPDVSLVTETIDEVTPKGIRLVSGEELEFDLIVLASGFHANEFLHPMHVEGRGGKTLREFWSKDGGRAYLGMMVPGFPNFFALYGPNTNPKTGGPIEWSELATRYILGCLKAMVDHSWSSMEIKEDVFDEHQQLIDASLERAIWTDKSQKSYYRHPVFDRVDVMTPFGTIDYWRWTQEANLDEFIVRSGDPSQLTGPR